MKVIVVEDSRLAREGLVNMLKAYPNLQVVGAADHPSTAKILIKEFRPDVLFLDIHMPGESGFDLLDSLEYSPKVIFTTAYSEYAIRSFDYSTVDYLLKPISHERLAKAIHKLTTKEVVPITNSERLDIGNKIFINDGGRCFLVPLDTIHYFESCKNHVKVYFEKNNAFIRKPLNDLEDRLPLKYFFRANRQFIINLQAVARIDEAVQSGFDATMIDGRIIDISRRNATALKDLMCF